MDERIRVGLPRGLTVLSSTGGPSTVEGNQAALRSFREDLSRRLDDADRDTGGTPPEQLPSQVTGLSAGAVHDDESQVWFLHAGRERHLRTGWSHDDLDLAVNALTLFSESARRLLRHLVNRPGELVPAEDLAEAVQVPGAFGVAGVLNGFVRGCESADRAFPLHAFERPQGYALYGMRPSTALLFRQALDQHGAEPIRARRDPRWYTDVVPEAVNVLAQRAREPQLTIRYKELADTLRRTVPGARVPTRGLVMGWLLHDVAKEIYKIDPTLPQLTSLVVTSDGKPSSGFLQLYRELHDEMAVDAAEEQAACAAAYTEHITARLVTQLRHSTT